MSSYLRMLVLAFLCLLSVTVDAQEISFNAESVLTASSESLDGRVSLVLNSSEPVFHVQVFALAQANKHSLGEIGYWEPGSRTEFAVHLPSRHAYPGDYHLLVEIAFSDQSGGHHGLSVAIAYRVEAASIAGDTLSAKETVSVPVAVAIVGDRVEWRMPRSGVSRPELAVTTEPSWKLPAPLNPSDSRIVLEVKGDRPPIPGWSYQQTARLQWVQHNRHYSHAFGWLLHTDADGKLIADPLPLEPGPWWRKSSILWLLAVLIAASAGLFRERLTGITHANRASSRQQEWVGGIVLCALTIWSIAHANPALWLTHTWSTGGDIASQVFYAQIFMEWLPKGKISGWLPESFAGFPAFTFYFPFPFTLAGLLQFGFGQQVAFKLVSMLPAFLLPAASYLLAYSWGWRVPMRLLSAAGASAFILADATSIWGGNVLAQLSGEFAYSWGLLFAVLFWAALAPALNKGGRWWLLAAVLEALVALSHGYALLIAGFGAFVYLLVSRNMWRDLRMILQIHLLAFLLIGFWLMPLLENFPWTIPNDGVTTVESWQTLWPKALWPLTLGWIPLGWILLRKSAGQRPGFLILGGICMLGLLGFILGGQAGMADLRFFPFSQWALAVACGAALGWWLQRWQTSIALPMAVAALVALSAWWEPLLGQLEDWSAWNLSGYENKALWPHYLATARANAGELHGPRLVFEHDPASHDLGSTRALEALPMFGSRPALEGLYMESAITGPFIYQLQAEISQRPSSPLTRYPSSARSIEDAVGHLNELYVDRVIVRSYEKQTLFGADPRFTLVAEYGPLQTYEFKELETQLVDVITTPLVGRDRENWLAHAFHRFLTDIPYQERYVYLANNEGLPGGISGSGKGKVEVKEFSRERFVFQTDRPGQPHLIRMSYHPRWESKGGEKIFLTEPSFMLIYPRDTSVELIYGWSWGDRLGVAFSLAGVLLLAWGLSRSPVRSVASQPTFMARRRRFFGFSGAVVLVILVIWWSDPESAYQRGHRLLTQENWVAAADQFDRAFDGRRTVARQSEALFWAARSLDQGNRKQEALTRYRKLRSEFPESYWYPESVYRLIEIHLSGGERDAAESLYAGLLEHVPDNEWTRKAENLFAGPGA